ncbi:MAG: sodium transporter, partial [Gemmatimonadota bacterium]
SAQLGRLLVGSPVQAAAVMAATSAVPREQESEGKRFGAFAGVFTPTLLTILGVIMYLRLPWVVGNAGLVGALLVVALASGVTLATGLSLSSIATNTRLGAGGPYAIVSHALGYEVGASVGVPLYLSQALAVSMYIFGFREGWNWIFPTHPALVVDLVMFFAVLGIAYVSADLAFRVQYVVLAVIVGSLVAVLGNVSVWQSTQEIQLFGSYPGVDAGPADAHFWAVFAVFFPAATGILAGANMSGELANSRKSIPVGTLSAIGVSSLVYLALVFWSAKATTPDELATNYTVMIDHSLWSPIVVAGLLGATFSSALSSLVGAPRILQALSRDRLVPAGAWLARRTRGEPRRAMLVTGFIVLVSLMARDLNVIAPLLTMFFLITYTIINVVMLAEGSLGLMSFRPTLRIPRVVPLLGTIGCVFAMFIVNPTFSLVAIGVVAGIYSWQLWRGKAPRIGTVRSGIFVAFAEWAAGKVIEHDLTTSRAWKPSLVIPVRDPTQLRGEFRILVDMCQPEGYMKILGIATTETAGNLTPRVENLTRSFQKAGVMTTASIIDSAGFTEGIVTGLQALRSAFFRPNVLFLKLPEAGLEGHSEIAEVMHEAERLKIGVMLLGYHPTAGFGRQKVVNLWLSPRSPEQSVRHYLDQTNQNLAILAALRIRRAWDAELNLISVVPDEAAVRPAQEALAEVLDLCRIPNEAVVQVLAGDFAQIVREATQADLEIFGSSHHRPMQFMAELIQDTRATCMFLLDSGQEDALA